MTVLPVYCQYRAVRAQVDELPSRVAQLSSPAKETEKSAGTNSQQSSPAKQPAETPSDVALVIPTTENMSDNDNESPPPKSKSTLKGWFF